MLRTFKDLQGQWVMTTDPEEGQRQAEAMKPTPLKVGDKVRLSAGGSRVMTVKSLEDYGNMAVCEWEPAGSESEAPEHTNAMVQDTLPVRSLVRVDE